MVLFWFNFGNVVVLLGLVIVVIGVVVKYVGIVWLEYFGGSLVELFMICV